MFQKSQVFFIPPKPVFVKTPEVPNIGFVSVFYAKQPNPLKFWERHDGIGYIRRVDEHDASSIQLLGTSSLRTCLATPVRPYTSLGIRLPHMSIILKNLNRSCGFDVQIEDDKKIRRRFQFGTKLQSARKRPHICFIPLGLYQDWNEIPIDLQHCTNKTYGTNYVQTIRVQVYPNCRLRQIYFSQTPITLQKALSIMNVLLIEGNDTFDTKRIGDNGIIEPLPPPIEIKLKNTGKKKIKSQLAGSEAVTTIPEEEDIEADITPDSQAKSRKKNKKRIAEFKVNSLLTFDETDDADSELENIDDDPNSCDTDFLFLEELGILAPLETGHLELDSENNDDFQQDDSLTLGENAIDLTVKLSIQNMDRDNSDSELNLTAKSSSVMSWNPYEDQDFSIKAFELSSTLRGYWKMVQATNENEEDGILVEAVTSKDFGCQINTSDFEEQGTKSPKKTEKESLDAASIVNEEDLEHMNGSEQETQTKNKQLEIGAAKEKRLGENVKDKKNAEDADLINLTAEIVDPAPVTYEAEDDRDWTKYFL